MKIATHPGWLRSAALALLLSAAPAAQVHAQVRFLRPGEAPPIDAATRAAMVDSLSAALDSAYVFADTARAMISRVHERLASGAYDAKTDPTEFAQALEEDVLSVYRDKHFQIVIFPPEPAAPENPPAAQHDDPTRAARLSQNNAGFKKIEVLPGNIGYLELTQFAPADAAGAKAAAAMQLLSGCDAVIIDLRKNGGGSADMIALLAGYFFDESKHLVSWYVRMRNETTQSWSLPYVPGERMPETPLYILTSSRTGSAAEEFTYDMKNLERATIVGETTGGAAHTVSFWFYDFTTFRMAVKMPTGRAISPITKTNWEAKGVEPDIAVPSEKALETAQIEALKALQAKAGDDDARRKLAWALGTLEAQTSTVSLSSKQLRQFTGIFGPRTLTISGDALCSQRTGGPRITLVPIGADLFKISDGDDVRFRFLRDEGGRVARLQVSFIDGREEITERVR